MGASSQLPREVICLWGEVVQVRHSKPQLWLRDRENSNQRLWVSLPDGQEPIEEGHMLGVEGTLSIHVDEEEGALALHLDGHRLVKNWGYSKRIKDQRRALDDIAALCDGPPPTLKSAFTKIALVSSENSKGRQDFEKVLREKVKYNLAIERFFVSLMDADSIADGIRRAGESDADLLVITRGGGSSELQLFSEPIVVRALAQLSKPAAVAIGHVSDSVASERFVAYAWGTPSQAAYEIARLFYQLQPRASPSDVRRDVQTRRQPVRTHPTKTDTLRSEPEAPPFSPPPKRWWQFHRSKKILTAREEIEARFASTSALFLRWTVLAALWLAPFVVGWQGAPLWNSLLDSFEQVPVAALPKPTEAVQPTKPLAQTRKKPVVPIAQPKTPRVMPTTSVDLPVPVPSPTVSDAIDLNPSSVPP